MCGLLVVVPVGFSPGASRPVSVTDEAYFCRSEPHQGLKQPLLAILSYQHIHSWVIKSWLWGTLLKR